MSKLQESVLNDSDHSLQPDFSFTALRGRFGVHVDTATGTGGKRPLADD
jgi:hypothetical protein